MAGRLVLLQGCPQHQHPVRSSTVLLGESEGSPSVSVAKEDKAEVDILSTALISIVNAGVNVMDLLEAFLTWRIQPLQARAHPMWVYEGPSDPTRVHPEELAETDVGAKIKAITCARDTPRGARLVPAYSKELPPTVEVKCFCLIDSLVRCFLYI